MLRRIRAVLALMVLVGITLLFLDFTGTLAAYFSFLAKIQLWPALLAFNLVAIIVVLAMTLLLGRIYCSLICPLGIYQDVVNHLSARIFKKKRRLAYSKPLNYLRYPLLGLVVVASVAGFMPVVALLDPYSIFGRLAANLLLPGYQAGNNVLANIAAHYDSYAFYPVAVRFLGAGSLVAALLYLIILTVMAGAKGRIWCNTICPVGTLLGLISPYALIKPTIDQQKCNKCGLCSRGCKGSCIDSKNQQIDYSRCVACLDCLDLCHQEAIKLTAAGKRKGPQEEGGEAAADESKRAFLAGAVVLGLTSVVKAAESQVDGGLAPLKPKNKPERQTPILPPGAHSAANLAAKCSGCQLCASVCKSGIIISKIQGGELWQPRLDFSQAYCRPECTRCSNVCPTGALKALTAGEKASRQIGRAVWVEANCLTAKGYKCTACERHCPSGAIRREDKMVIVDPSRCIGCGACEYYCPARPNGAIYVEGVEVQREV